MKCLISILTLMIYAGSAIAQILEVEPNEPCSMAQNVGFISFPETVLGILDTHPDDPNIDFFRISAPQGAALTAKFGAESLSVIDPIVGLFDSACNLLDQAGVHPIDRPKARIDFIVPADGEFIIAATSWPDYDFTGELALDSGPYELTISETPPLIGLISGRVVNLSNGEPVPGSSPTKASAELIRCNDGLDCFDFDSVVQRGIDSQGNFRFDGVLYRLSPGTYRVIASARWFQDAETDPFTVSEGEDFDLGDIAIEEIPRPYVEALVIPDVTGDSINEVAIVRGGAVNVAVANVTTGQTILNSIYFDDPFEPAGIAAIPDVDGNNVTEIAAVGVDDTGMIKVRIADGLTGTGIRNSVYFDEGYQAVDLAAVSDLSGNAAAEVAVLAIRQSDSRIFVKMRDSLTGQNAIGKKIAFLSPDFTPLELVVLPDINNSGSDELVVFGTQNIDGRGLVEVREADGSPGRDRRWYLSSDFTPKAIAIGDDFDSNGIPEIAMLAERNSDGRIVVERRNASGEPATTRRWFFIHFPHPQNMRAVDFEAIADTNNDGLPEYAVLAMNSDGWSRVEISNVGVPTAKSHQTYLDPLYGASQLLDFGDTDVNGISNLGVLSVTPDSVQIELRDATTFYTKQGPAPSTIDFELPP
jgi:hypothetical protein